MFKLDDPKNMAHYHNLDKQALTAGIGKSEKEEENQPATSEKGIEFLWRPHKGGCDACNHSGYKGRIGIYEAMPNTPEIQTLIVNNTTSAKIQDTAVAASMITMQMDGFIKSLRGLTAVEEILRVTRE
jgi:type II secretory ATPase GspE/PulE/Tfp pilus assembly ATPase PilB-like protein